MDLSALSDVLAYAGTLAKEIGKGGGGSTEEPTVCMSLLPVALGVAFVAVQRLCDSGRHRAENRTPERLNA